MTTYDIAPLPNQEFTINEDGTVLRLHVSTFRGLMYCDIYSQDGTVLVAGLRCVDRKWLVPYPAYRPEGFGNIRFEDVNGEYPYYLNFGKSCFLRYYAADEIAEGVD